jgi:exosome complex component RRP40
MNGRVWIDAKEPKNTIAVVRCIEAVDPDGGGMDKIQLRKFLASFDI